MVSMPPGMFRGVLLIVALLAIPARSVGSEPIAPLSPEIPTGGFRGVFFNPNIEHRFFQGYPWPVFDPYEGEYRERIRTALRELVEEARINLIALFIPIPFTLASPPQAPQAGQSIEDWANLQYLDNLALFVEDCQEAGLSVELDLADNRWIPYSVDTPNHIGRPGDNVWPVADETPWEESALWYSQVIRYVEAQTEKPEAIAFWSMMGNYQHGTAEPCLWNCNHNPAITSGTERFVKEVWPVFRSAGKRPKAAPYTLPIFSNNDYWKPQPPEERLSGFSNLKKWLSEDLEMPPDYWPMTTYTHSDPAPDGVYYIRKIVEILGPENTGRILSTDFKGPGHEEELADSIVSAGTHTGAERIQWNLEKCAEYGFAGWWIYSYQDQENFPQETGIRSAQGEWKRELLLPILSEFERH
jgi:hypothetical protein